MSEIDAMMATMGAENMALRALLAGLLVEFSRRGYAGIVSSAFGHAAMSLAGVMRDEQPSSAQQEAADRILRQMRDEVLGASDAR